MTAFDGSENRSWDVRRSARAQLRALRADRLSRREAVRTRSGDWSGMEGPATPEPGEAFDVRIPSEGAVAQAMDDDGTTVDVTVLADGDAAVLADGGAAVLMDGGVAVLADGDDPADMDGRADASVGLAPPGAAAASDAQGATMTASNPEGADAEPAGATARAEPDPIQPGAVSDQDGPDLDIPDLDTPVQADGRAPSAGSDLLVLPGIGPGLVWLFEQAGVRTLQDLAEADPAVLRSDLGLVGDLLDIDYWIGIARH